MGRLGVDRVEGPCMGRTGSSPGRLVGNYSTLPYFDSLIINGFRAGSVIVDYTVQLLGEASIDKLVTLTTSLEKTKLVTTGIIIITVPENQPIDIGSTVDITCTPPQPPPAGLSDVEWFLTDANNKTTQITKGIEAELTNKSLTNILQLKNISGSWEGTFKCIYKQGSIEHTASKELDIALLPEIQAWSNPQFPDCRDETKKVQCEIECKILNSSENYTIQWDGGVTTQVTENQGKFISYKAEMTINCRDNKETVSITCRLTNVRSRKNKSASATVAINIIKKNSLFCSEDKGWPIAKSNFTASMPCVNSAVGLKTRECNEKGNWQNEISSCVNVELDDIKKNVEALNKGIGFIKDDAKFIFESIWRTTTSNTFNAFSNIQTSIGIFGAMNNVSLRQSNQWNDSVMPDLVNSASNFLNDTNAWKNPEGKTNLSITFLQTIERMMNNSNLSSLVPYKYDNVELKICKRDCKTFNASVTADSGVAVVAFSNLYQIFPQPENITATSETTILSVTNVNNTNTTKIVELMFEYSNTRLPNYIMYCVFWDETNNKWSEEGCNWGGADNPKLCTCNHNSAFTILMSKTEETLPYMEELTYVGLGISIVSLVICLIIEILIWDTVVKSDISNFRHVAIFNICLCLLLADCAFLASAEPEKIRDWCFYITVVKHFFFLTVFFWMLCLSFVILHQIIFVFDHLRKRVFMGLSITLGYVCPILCVAITLIAFKNGAVKEYYSEKTCWLIYKGAFKGSIFAFVFPVGTIVFINFFTLAVVIMKIVTPTVSEAKARDEKEVAKSMIKTMVFLSPVLGITWILGFFVLDIDLTKKTLAYFVNYTFTILNSLQGFFILLTNCLGEKKVRDALRKRFKGSKQSAHSKSESSTKMTSSLKKK
ncbi:adhesion G protein-coupled receptor F4 [Pseudorasbora parva]|uniref:adhesion G protein-coupled receptor F4 n=1 Tax=Pseudorasbora parva TaxID=51549 RepID=UPI00351DC608